MYWNTLKYSSMGLLTGWIVTLDVLKYSRCIRYQAIYLLNSNIRCIEIRNVSKYKFFVKSWIVTLDVLKYYARLWDMPLKALNSNIRCIEIFQLSL